MIERIDELRSEAEGAIATAGSTSALEELRVRYLGRKAELPNLLRGVAELPPDQRGTVGRAANQARQALESLIEQRTSELEAAELDTRLAQDRSDVPRIVYAPQRDAQRSGGRAPPLLVDAERPRPGSEAGHRIEQLRLDVDTRAQLVHSWPARVGRGAQQVLALGHEAVLAAPLQAADLLELVVVLAGDHCV